MVINQNVIIELRKLLELIEEERRQQFAQLDRLMVSITDALEYAAAGRKSDTRLACKVVLDIAHEALGDCEPAELFCALLGYSEEGDES